MFEVDAGDGEDGGAFLPPGYESETEREEKEEKGNTKKGILINLFIPLTALD